VQVLLGPAHFADVHQAFNAGFEFNESAVISDVGDAAGELATRRILGVHTIPRVGQQLLHAERNALGVRVDLHDLDFHRVAHIEHLARVVDALPAHVGDVQQAVDAAEINEGAVIGDVFHNTFADFAFLQLADDFSAFRSAALFEHGATRNNDVAALPVHFQDRERLHNVHQRADVADRTDINLRTRQERVGAAEINSEAALHAANQRAVHGVASGE